MAIIHYGFIPRQNLIYLTRLVPIAENPAGIINNEIIAGAFSGK